MKSELNYNFLELKNYNDDNLNEIILNGLNSLIEDGCQSEPYTVENTKFFKPKDVSNIGDIDIIDYLMFKINRFYYYITSNANYMNDCEEWMRKEIEYIYERNHCVFFSIISKFIIETLTDCKVNFNQGYYCFKNDVFARMLFGEMSSGFHSWCDINGAVLDTTFVVQQFSSYDGDLNNMYFIGNQPEDITLVGYTEKEPIILKYLKELLDINNFSYREWLSKHIDFFNNLE